MISLLNSSYIRTSVINGKLLYFIFFIYNYFSIFKTIVSKSSVALWIGPHARCMTLKCWCQLFVGNFMHGRFSNTLSRRWSTILMTSSHISRYQLIKYLTVSCYLHNLELCNNRHRRVHDHDDVINWKHILRFWPFVRGIHRWPVDSPHKGQWRVTLTVSLICTWING